MYGIQQKTPFVLSSTSIDCTNTAVVKMVIKGWTDGNHNLYRKWDQQSFRSYEWNYFGKSFITITLVGCVIRGILFAVYFYEFPTSTTSTYCHPILISGFYLNLILYLFCFKYFHSREKWKILSEYEIGVLFRYCPKKNDWRRCYNCACAHDTANNQCKTFCLSIYYFVETSFGLQSSWCVNGISQYTLWQCVGHSSTFTKISTVHDPIFYYARKQETELNTFTCLTM